MKAKEQRDQSKQHLQDVRESVKNSRINNKKTISQELRQGNLLFKACYEADTN